MPTYDPTPREDAREDAAETLLDGIERAAFDRGARAMRECASRILMRAQENSYERNVTELRIRAVKVEELEGRP